MVLPVDIFAHALALTMPTESSERPAWASLDFVSEIRSARHQNRALLA
jgi:hypothetical protein